MNNQVLVDRELLERAVMSTHCYWPDAPIIKEIQAVLSRAVEVQPVSALQPRAMVVPEGWIAVSDRLPDEDGAYWCWFGGEQPSVVQQRVCIFIER